MRHSFGIQANWPCSVILGRVENLVNVKRVLAMIGLDGSRNPGPLVSVLQFIMAEKLQMQYSTVNFRGWIEAAAGTAVHWTHRQNIARGHNCFPDGVRRTKSIAIGVSGNS